MSCATSHTPFSRVVQLACGAAIAGLSCRANPRYFATATTAGIIAQLFFPKLSVYKSGPACAAGCSGVAGESLGLTLNKNIAFIVGTVLFCGHIDHCKGVSAATVGTLFGMRVVHFIRDDLRFYPTPKAETALGKTAQ